MKMHCYSTSFCIHIANYMGTTLLTWSDSLYRKDLRHRVTGLLGLQCATHHLYLQTIRSSKADCNCLTASQVDTLRRAENFERLVLPNHLI